MYMEYTWPCILLKSFWVSAHVSKWPVTRKWMAVEQSGVKLGSFVISTIYGVVVLDLLLFNVILGSFGALVSKLPLTRKQLTLEENWHKLVICDTSKTSMGWLWPCSNVIWWLFSVFVYHAWQCAYLLLLCVLSSRSSRLMGLLVIKYTWKMVFVLPSIGDAASRTCDFLKNSQTLAGVSQSNLAC